MNADKINAKMQELIAANEMAGGALIVRKNGDVLFDDVWGMADIEHKKPVTHNTVFRMASVSKTMTCVGFLKLVDSGKIGLDDLVSDYIPEFKHPRVVADERFTLDKFSFDNIPNLMAEAAKGDIKTVPASRELTVKDLISHSCGLEMGVAGYMLALLMDYRGDNIDDRTQKYAKFPLDFQPGTATGYSPRAAFDILSRITEIVSSKSFDAYMRDEVFMPLDMKDTSFRPSEEQITRLAKLYTTENGQLKDVSKVKDIDGLGLIGDRYISASAGVFSTIHDFDRFVTMLANGGILANERILSEKIVAEIGVEAAYNHLEMRPGASWGLGMLIRINPEKAGSSLSKGAYGWSGAYGTHFFVSPSDKVSAAFCMSRENIGGSGSYIAKLVEDLIYED